MTTSNPDAPQPAGAADPEGEDHDNKVNPLLQSTLEGAVPDEQIGDEPSEGESDRKAPDPDADSVDDDREASGA